MRLRNVAVAFGLAAVATCSAAPARASDPHIQSVFYQPDQIVELRGAVGWQTMIEFGADERIENVSIGDSTAWQVVPNKRARMLFVKPLKARASTNMTVITTSRQYSFDLSVGARHAGTPWMLRFKYPPAAVEVAPKAPPTPTPINLNFQYQRAGDPGLLPSRVWDDGHQTYFEFGEDAALPAIFAGGPKKDESLVNVTVRGRIIVVQQLALRFTLRAGKRVATVTKQP